MHGQEDGDCREGLEMTSACLVQTLCQRLALTLWQTALHLRSQKAHAVIHRPVTTNTCSETPMEVLQERYNLFNCNLCIMQHTLHLFIRILFQGSLILNATWS
ncbi:unnamed protein product [Nezara viridula]|uniref:Uncharacterized protein n=1 Tax=Nezara viridula TaxID=85310 RepID=A0A9P0H2X2_NEZVI|nr:unnamed protein product [Nezara viridula]